MISEDYGSYSVDAWAEHSVVSDTWRPHARIRRVRDVGVGDAQTFDAFVTAYAREADAELFARFEARRLIDRKIAGLSI
jgi:hypothetical protein